MVLLEGLSLSMAEPPSNSIWRKSEKLQVGRPTAFKMDSYPLSLLSKAASQAFCRPCLKLGQT